MEWSGQGLKNGHNFSGHPKKARQRKKWGEGERGLGSEGDGGFSRHNGSKRRRGAEGLLRCGTSLGRVGWRPPMVDLY
jgi:hypothetical protein